MDENKFCRSCKWWGLNCEAELNGIENTTRTNQAHCENENILNSLQVWETNLPDYIVPNIRSDFVTSHTFGCTYWELFKDWERLQN